MRRLAAAGWAVKKCDAKIADLYRPPHRRRKNAALRQALCCAQLRADGRLLDVRAHQRQQSAGAGKPEATAPVKARRSRDGGNRIYGKASCAERCLRYRIAPELFGLRSWLNGRKTEADHGASQYNGGHCAVVFSDPLCCVEIVKILDFKEYLR